MNEGGGNFSEGDKDELPPVQTGVGKDKIPRSHDSIPIEQQVNIYLPGSPTERNRPSQTTLCLLKPSQEFHRTEQRTDLENSIQKITLGSISYRRCVVKKRGLYHPNLRGREVAKGLSEVARSAADV